MATFSAAPTYTSLLHSLLFLLSHSQSVGGTCNNLRREVEGGACTSPLIVWCGSLLTWNSEISCTLGNGTLSIIIQFNLSTYVVYIAILLRYSYKTVRRSKNLTRGNVIIASYIGSRCIRLIFRSHQMTICCFRLQLALYFTLFQPRQPSIIQNHHRRIINPFETDSMTSSGTALQACSNRITLQFSFV